MPLPKISFAKNDIGFIDSTGVDHDGLGQGLKKAIYNFMHGVGMDEDIRNWFDSMNVEIPRPSISKRVIAKAIEKKEVKSIN